MTTTPTRNRAARFARLRGATFTIMVLVTSAILLSIGGKFVTPSRNLIFLNGLRERQEQAKEALAGAAEWSRASVGSWSGGRTSERVVLRLSRASVELEVKASDEGFVADMLATSHEAKVRARVTLVSRDGRWRVGRYELLGDR